MSNPAAMAAQTEFGFLIVTPPMRGFSELLRVTRSPSAK
jgi:hypothetical protein